MKSYVYQVKDLKDNTKYIGARRSLKPDLIEDFREYGTSSYKKYDIINNPQNYEVEILKIFETLIEAMDYEAFLHELHDVATNPLFWNKTKSKGYNQFNDATDTVMCFDNKLNRLTRVSRIEFYSNARRYQPNKGYVTVRIKGTDKCFNVPRNYFRENRDILEQNTAGKVLCRRRGSNDQFKKIPKSEYNKELHETPSEIRSKFYREGKTLSVIIKETGVKTYIDPKDYNKDIHNVSGDVKFVIIDGVIRRVSQNYILENNLTPISLESRWIKIIGSKKYEKITAYEYTKDYIPKHRVIDYKIFKCRIGGKEHRLPKNVIDWLRRRGYNVVLNSTRVGCVNVFDKSDGVMKSISKEIYLNNKDSYIICGAKFRERLEAFLKIKSNTLV